MTILFKVEDFTRKIYKVTGSQDDDFVANSRCKKKSVFSDFYCPPNKLALMGQIPGDEKYPNVWRR